MNLKKNLPLKIPLSTLPDVKLTPQINKVIYGDRVLLDLTNDTVTESSVLKGVTFHKADGFTSLGTYEPLDISVSTVTPETILEGYKAYNSNGELIIGTYTPPIPRYFVLDYIQSTGTQYINTGYIPLANDVFEIKTKLISNTSNSYEALFGTRLTNYKSNAYCLFVRFNSSNKFTYNRTGAETGLSNGIYDSVITITTSGQNISWTNGTNTYSGTTTGTVNDCVNPLFIFNANTASTAGGATADTSPAYAQLYSFIAKRTDENIHEYIPVRQLSDMTIGLYDKVNNIFYANAGSGTFTAGTWTGEVIY